LREKGAIELEEVHGLKDGIRIGEGNQKAENLAPELGVAGWAVGPAAGHGEAAPALARE